MAEFRLRSLRARRLMRRDQPCFGPASKGHSWRDEGKGGSPVRPLRPVRNSILLINSILIMICSTTAFSPVSQVSPVSQIVPPALERAKES